MEAKMIEKTASFSVVGKRRRISEMTGFLGSIGFAEVEFGHRIDYEIDVPDQEWPVVPELVVQVVYCLLCRGLAKDQAARIARRQGEDPKNDKGDSQ